MTPNKPQRISGLKRARKLLTGVGLLLVFVASQQWLLAQNWPRGVQRINARSNAVTTVRGDLRRGAPVADLSWATSSSVACFPTTVFESYRGAHVFYGTAIPPRSVMKIKVQPEAGVDVNLYAYILGTNDFSTLPPNITGVTTCESSENYGQPNPGGSQEVELNAIANGYNVVIVVAGPAGVTSGRYSLSVDLKTAAAEPTAPTGMRSQTIPTVSGQTATVNSRLDGGYILPLDWANTSQLACFPSHHNPAFRGKHVFFRAALPANSQMKIVVRPARPDLDLSIYGIRLSANDATTMPPNIHAGVCDASYASRGGDPGVEETLDFIAIQNPYTILIGVAGPEGVTSGDFTISVELKPR